jgi:hypothetical protein
VAWSEVWSGHLLEGVLEPNKILDYYTMVAAGC